MNHHSSIPIRIFGFNPKSNNFPSSETQGNGQKKTKLTAIINKIQEIPCWRRSDHLREQCIEECMRRLSFLHSRISSLDPPLKPNQWTSPKATEFEETPDRLLKTWQRWSHGRIREVWIKGIYRKFSRQSGIKSARIFFNWKLVKIIIKKNIIKN